MISGRIWKFGDNINTDLMMPGPALYLPEAERIRYVFQANRPGWVDQVRRGDFIIGGIIWRRLQPAGCVVASQPRHRLPYCGIDSTACSSATASISDCWRSNIAGVHTMFEEGQTASVSTDDLTVSNEQTGEVRKASAVPRQLVDLMCGGGIFPLLESQGLIAPLPMKNDKTVSA